jgi:hypothetical protein
VSSADHYLEEIARTRKPEGVWRIMGVAMDDEDLDRPAVERVLERGSARVIALVTARRVERGLPP